MKEWYSAQEITGLPGLPGTKQGVIKMISRESWRSRKREGRGGGFEYHLSSLPKKTQKSLRISYAKRSVNKSFAEGNATGQELLAQEQDRNEARLQRLDNGIREYMKLKGKARARSDAKQQILTAAEKFMHTSGVGGHTGIGLFTAAYNRGDIKLALWVHETCRRFSSRSLYNWFRTYREEGIAALAGNFGQHRKGTGIIDRQESLREYIIGMIVEHPHIKYSVLYKAIEAEFNGQTITLPSTTTLERWVGKWKSKHLQVYTAVTNPDEWKNKYMVAFGSASEDIIELNQQWEFDSTPADVMLTDGRHSLIGIIDVYSRRFKLAVSKTSNSKSVAQLFRAAIIDWGVPLSAKTDNGSDYVSNHIKSVFSRFDIHQELCPPFQGWRKPHIERVFRTFSHDIAELLPGFIGHNVTERKAIEARKSFSDRLFEKDAVIDIKMNSAELQQFCNDWIDSVYHRNYHDGLGKTPLEAVRGWKGSVSKVDDVRVLDVLLSEPAGTRIVRKKGISLDTGMYIHPLLAGHVGEEVQIYYDDQDMGSVYVYNCFGEFLCIAEDPDTTGVSRAEVAIKAREVQRDAVQEERRRLKAAARKVTKRDVAQQILDHRTEQARKEKVTEFPKREEIHNSDGIEAAKDTLGFKTSPSSLNTALTAEDKALSEEADKKLAKVMTLNSPIHAEESDEDLYRRWCTLDACVNNGATLAGQEAIFYQSFPTTPEYKVIKKLEKIGLYQQVQS